MSAASGPQFEPSFADQVVNLGRDGLSRAEISAKLGVSLRQLAIWADQHPAFDRALDLADTEARAWWDRIAREAVLKDGVFRATAWAKAMAQRARPASSRGPTDVKVDKPRPRIRVEIPDNGRPLRRRPERTGG